MRGYGASYALAEVSSLTPPSIAGDLVGVPDALGYPVRRPVGRDC